MKYIEKLRNSGLRPTKQRLQICEVLFDTDKTFHFTINDLDLRIKKQISKKISLATIYKFIVCVGIFFHKIEYSYLLDFTTI